jgi:hypothetical protein
MKDSIALSINHEHLLEGLKYQIQTVGIKERTFPSSFLPESGESLLLAPYLHPRASNNLVINTNNLKFIREKCRQLKVTTIFNIKLINYNRYINKYLEGINACLPYDGIYIGKLETYNVRRHKIYNKYPGVINHMVYFADTLYHRIMPKLPVLKKIYFFFSNGRYRLMGRPEALGRLSSCGFDVIAEKNLGNYFYFVARKTREPLFDKHATYGPIIRLKRHGKQGKLFQVYKFRTMYPYSEYLQEYVYRQNKLDKSGKFKNDFRVTPWGRFMRRFWLDELPMIYNFLKGEMQLVGVRPLSQMYFSLYTEEMKIRRTRSKPGLIPPYYAVYPTPKGLDQIMKNELEYLDAFEKAPWTTNWNYFWRAAYNIIIRHSRSN